MVLALLPTISGCAGGLHAMKSGKFWRQAEAAPKHPTRVHVHSSKKKTTSSTSMALNIRDAFLARVDTICKRPGMYVGTESLRDVATYLDGMYDGLTRNVDGECYVHPWCRWLEGRYMVRQQAQPWRQVLCNVLGSDKAALAALPDLYREFFQDLDSLGEDGIEQRTLRRFIARQPSGN